MSKRKLFQKWNVAFKILPLVVLVGLAKFGTHYFGIELMELNALFTSLVAGTIFLIGFLISGVLTDYKESEKIPAELTASLRTLLDDTLTIQMVKATETSQQFLQYQKSLIQSLSDWFYRKERTRTMLGKVSDMNRFFADLEKEGTPANFIIKMKNEQNTIRKIILRIDTIRDTSFAGSAYAIVEAMGFLTALGLLLIRIEPFYASLFLTVLITFLILYMVFLIRDLDNPFDYRTNGETGTEISLKPFHDLEKEITEWP